MTRVGYCTVEDLRRALRKSDLPGDASQDREIALDAITGQTEWLQEETNRHWFDPDGVVEDEDDLIPTEPLTHEMDEQDIETSAVIFADDEISPSTNGPGPYTTVNLFRRDVLEVTELLVLNDEGSFDDWVADDEFEEGRGADYWLQVDDADGWTSLYLNTNSLEDEMTDYRGAVLATYEYGIEGASAAKTIRRAIALRAGAHFAEEAAIQIPENARLGSIETKAQEMRNEAEELLGIHEDTR
ncbi:hypothetical protein GCM10009725_30340 [Aeromicrobium tamlense]